MWSAIIAGIIGLAGTAVSTGIQGRAAREAGEKQNLAIAKANKQSREDWREAMEKEEEERRKNALRGSMQSFQNTLNKSSFLKQQVSSLWAGRG